MCTPPGADAMDFVDEYNTVSGYIITTAGHVDLIVFLCTLITSSTRHTNSMYLWNVVGRVSCIMAVCKQYIVALWTVIACPYMDDSKPTAGSVPCPHVHGVGSS